MYKDINHILWESKCFTYCNQTSISWKNKALGNWLSYCEREAKQRNHEIVDCEVQKLVSWFFYKALDPQQFNELLSKLKMVDIYQPSTCGDIKSYKWRWISMHQW